MKAVNKPTISANSNIANKNITNNNSDTANYGSTATSVGSGAKNNVVNKTDNIATPISPYKFGSSVTPAQQATRNADIASKMNAMISTAKANGQTLSPMEAFQKVTGVMPDTSNPDMKNTIDKITNQAANVDTNQAADKNS